MPETITIQDVGPIQALTIPIQPGVTVLRGPSESGKSLATQAVSRLLGGEGLVTCRDDATSGLVEGLGVRLSVRQSVRRTGELEAVSIEGIDISGLVSPPIKDPEAADRYRIKSLLQLTGVKADINMFASLFPDDECFKPFCTAEVIKCDDLVEMAAKLKRNIDSSALSAARAAEKEEGFALGCQSAPEGIDLSIETDEDVLQAGLEDAIRRQASILSEATSARATISGAESAQSKLDAEGCRPDPEGARAGAEVASSSRKSIAMEVERITLDLALAEAALVRVTAEEEAALARLRLEEAHAETVKDWRETIEAGRSVDCPTLEAIAAAEQAVTHARRAIENAAIVRQAKTKLEEAQEHRNAAKALRSTSDGLREAAKGTEDVLSQAVHCDWATIKNGRIVTQQADRGKVFFADRSDGTRYKLAITEVLKRIRAANSERTAVIAISQGAWGELQPKNKAFVHQCAKEAGICVLTIEATDDDGIHAEVFDGD